MSDLRDQLSQCFRSVFPNLPESDIATASVETVRDWDSVAAITLLQVIEERFQRPMDLDRLGEFDSFEALVGYLSGIRES